MRKLGTGVMQTRTDKSLMAGLEVGHGDAGRGVAAFTLTGGYPATQ